MKKHEKQPNPNSTPSTAQQSKDGKNKPDHPTTSGVSATGLSKSAQTTRAEVDRLLSRVTDLVQKHPEKAATILAYWLSGSQTKSQSGSSKKSNKKAA